jgi:hypothetical protein
MEAEQELQTNNKETNGPETCIGYQSTCAAFPRECGSIDQSSLPSSTATPTPASPPLSNLHPASLGGLPPPLRESKMSPCIAISVSATKATLIQQLGWDEVKRRTLYVKMLVRHNSPIRNTLIIA